MTKADLKAGYLVIRRDGEHCIVMPSKEGLILCRDDDLLPDSCQCYRVDEYNEDLCDKDGVNEFDAMEIYDYPHTLSRLLSFDSVPRDLLWKREEVKELTVDEISNLLGYKVKVVGNN